MSLTYLLRVKLELRPTRQRHENRLYIHQQQKKVFNSKWPLRQLNAFFFCYTWGSLKREKSGPLICRVLAWGGTGTLLDRGCMRFGSGPWGSACNLPGEGPTVGNVTNIEELNNLWSQRNFRRPVRYPLSGGDIKRCFLLLINILL